jgi:hypothetical protein
MNYPIMNYPIMNYPIMNYPIIYPNNIVLINAMIDEDQVLYNLIGYVCQSLKDLFVKNILGFIIILNLLNILLFVFVYYVFYYKMKKIYEYEEKISYYQKVIDDLEWKNVLVNNRIEYINVIVLNLKNENQQCKNDLEEIYYEMKKNI